MKEGKTTTEWKAFLAGLAIAVGVAVATYLEDSGPGWAKIVGYVLSAAIANFTGQTYIRGRSVVKANTPPVPTPPAQPQG